VSNGFLKLAASAWQGTVKDSAVLTASVRIGETGLQLRTALSIRCLCVDPGLYKPNRAKCKVKELCNWDLSDPRFL